MASAFEPTIVGGVRQYHAFQDPADRLDYTFNFGGEPDWLEGDTVQSAVYTVADGLTEDGTQESATACLIWLKGGVHGSNYLVSCEIVTAAGRELKRSFTLRVRNR